MTTATKIPAAWAAALEDLGETASANQREDPGALASCCAFYLVARGNSLVSV